MIGLNYTVVTPDGPLPLGTPIWVGVLGAGGADVFADPVNAGRYSFLFPERLVSPPSGPTTITVIVNGYQPMVWQDTIPAGGGEADKAHNPLVLRPL